MKSNYVVINASEATVHDEALVEGELVSFTRKCFTIEATPLAEGDTSGTLKLVLFGAAREEFEGLLPGNVIEATFVRQK